MAREIGWAAALGLNAVRVRASPTAYRADPQRFASNFHAFLVILATHQMVALPVLFDTGDIGKVASKEENVTFLEQYLRAAVGAHADSPQILGFDVCNECYFTGHGAQAQLEALKQLIGAVHGLAPRGCPPRGAQWDSALAWSALALNNPASAARTGRYSAGKFTTTGMGDYGLWPGEMEQADWVDVVSFHSYNGNQTDFHRNVQELRGKATAAGKVLGFASEVMNRPWDPLCGDLAVLQAEGLGWFAWELMISDSGWGVPKCKGCPIYQGLLWPNGTAYNEEELSCIRAAATGTRDNYAPGGSNNERQQQAAAAAAVSWVPAARSTQ